MTLMLEYGFAIRSSDPLARVGEIAESLAEDGLGRRFKRSLMASDEMPPGEALAFEFWFARNVQGDAP